MVNVNFNDSRWRSLRKSKFVRSVSVRLLGTLATTALAVIISILTARLLGPFGKGAYFLLYSTLNTLIAVAGLKLVFSQAYYRKAMSLGQLLASSMVLSIIAGIGATCVGLAAIWPMLDSVYKGIHWYYLVVVVAMAPILLLAANLRSLLDVDYQTAKATVTMASRPFLFLLFFGTFAALGWFTVGSALTAMVISISGMTVVGAILLVWTARPDFTDLWDRSRRLILYSTRSHLGLVFRELQARFDVFIVAYFLSLADVGLYSVALTVSDMAGKLSQLISTVLLGRLAKERDGKKSLEAITRVSRIMFLLTGLFAIILALITPAVLTLAFGEAFESSATAIYILLPGVLAMSAFRNFNLILVMENRPGLFSLITSVGVTTMVVGDFLLIPQYGINGAAIASTFSFFMTVLLISVWVIRTCQVPFREFFDLRGAAHDLVKIIRSGSGRS